MKTLTKDVNIFAFVFPVRQGENWSDNNMHDLCDHCQGCDLIFGGVPEKFTRWSLGFSGCAKADISLFTLVLIWEVSIVFLLRTALKQIKN